MKRMACFLLPFSFIVILVVIGRASTRSAHAAGLNPVPQISQPLVPQTAAPGGLGFTLVVNGAGFVPNSLVKWNGSMRTTTFISNRQLTAAIPALDIAAAGAAWVTVFNPSPGGGTSNVVFFLVTNPTASIAMRRSDFATGQEPMFVTTGDFNGDGKLDLVVVNQNCMFPPCSFGSVSILLGNGDGTFQTHADYGVGLQPFSAATGDFNGDGKLDLAVVNTSVFANTVSILLGNGDGTFQAHVDYAAGTNPISVVAADLNGDGKLDLVLANRSSNTVSVLLGNGDGTFQNRVDYATANGPISLATGDFNADGKLDIAVVGNIFPSIPDAVSVLLGNGDGTFQRHVDYAVGNNANIISVADFNADGRLDLVVANLASRTISVLLGNGDGTFRPDVEFSTGGQPSSVTSGDFNGDDNLDLAVVSNDPNTASILLGNRDGTFQAHVDFGLSGIPSSLTAGDFNGDGRLDIAVANPESSTISILLQTTKDTTPPVTTPGVSPSPNASGWNNSNVTITLNSTDNEPSGSGVKQITYSLTGAQTIPSTVVSGASASFIISTEGITTITFFGTDNAGNVESPKTLTVQLDKTPPTITPTRAPAANANGWNSTNVMVSFQCSDALSGLAAGSPPASTTLSAEGANQSVSGTCTDLAGNSASATVSGINIDKTPPTVACSASPNVLWPPNNKLIPINVSVNVTDALSGSAGFTLVSVTSDEPDSGQGDIQGFVTGTTSTTGELRAQRLGTGSGRIYMLTYGGSDRAGNTASCTTTVTVPHDQGPN